MNVERETGPSQPVILLGASNLTMSFPLILENLSACLPKPVSVFAALGHGRSFGNWSRVLYRRLPGILDCGLWNEWAKHRDQFLPPKLLLTDIGNDLVYGVSVTDIMSWIESCLDRVSANPSDTIITLPPMASILQLSEWRFRVIRTLFFPGRNMSLADIRHSATELTAHLETLASARNITVVQPEFDWYGFDPIHLRRGMCFPAWKSILTCWPNFEAEKWTSQISKITRKQSSKSRFAHRKIFGRDQTSQQPTIQANGLAVWLY